MTTETIPNPDTFGPSDTPQPEQDYDAAVLTAFARGMNDKLAAARAKGRGGWYDPAVCTVTWLWDQMQEHARKPNLDMRDVANFAMMIDWRLENVPGDRHLLTAHIGGTPQPEQELERLQEALAEAEARERRLRNAAQGWRQMSQCSMSDADFDGLEYAANEVEDIFGTEQEGN